MSEIKESDWKLFKLIKEEALETFCKERLREYEDIIRDGTLSAHERYLYLFKLSRARDKEMELLFDGHSRSRAFLQLMAIRREGIANPDVVDKLSDEFKTATDPERFGD